MKKSYGFRTLGASKSPYITISEPYPSRNSPTNSGEEAKLKKLGLTDLGEIFETVVAPLEIDEEDEIEGEDPSSGLVPAVITILRGRFSHRSEIDVPLGRIDLRPPKIIVGVSLTLVGEGKSFPQRVITLPAILDTGFNRTLEIDEWHLVRWAGLRKEHLGHDRER